MPPVRERPKNQKVRENESTAALLATPRGTPRVLSRPRAPQKTPSRRLNTQDLLNKVQKLQAASRARGALPTPRFNRGEGLVAKVRYYWRSVGFDEGKKAFPA
jgi:hypothetical protein